MLPTADFFGTQLTRLMYGDNPFLGHTYVPQKTSSEALLNYYTTDRCVQALFELERVGVNGYVALADPFIIRMIRQYRNDGGKMHIIFQSFPPMDLEINLDYMMHAEPLGIYHQGGTADDYIESGRVDELRERLAKIKRRGIPVGLGTHVPEVILRAEAEEWGADFFAACLYNARNVNREGQRSYVHGKEMPGQLEFYPGDQFLMMDAIRKVEKPCLAFKILAGGQRILDLPEAQISKEIHRAMDETFRGIKPSDFAFFGSFENHKGEIAQNCEIAEDVLLGI